MSFSAGKSVDWPNSTTENEDEKFTNELRREKSSAEDVEASVPVPGHTISSQLESQEVYQLRDVTTANGQVETYKIVVFSPNDKANPKNWSKARRWLITMTLSLVCFSVAFSSAVVTPGIAGVAESFHVSSEVALLSVTLFVIGFGIGPLVFSPLSELYGRWIIYVATFGFAVIFIIPCAVAKNIETLLLCRAIGGIAISVPVANIGGSLADMWKPEERGIPMASFSAAPFLGPIMGPMIGGFVYENIGWRWLYWLQLILCGTFFVAILLFVPETYAPVILETRAKKLRKQTGDHSYKGEHELLRRSFKNIARVHLARPLLLLFTEPIVTLFAIYAAILYGILYIYPIVFEEGKGYSAGISGLMFLPITGGIILGLLGAPMVNRQYIRKRSKYTGLPPPELRLLPMIWVGPCLAGFPIGVGFVFLYNSFNNYIVDAYQHTAASALAAKTLLRSIWGGSTVLFTTQMYHNLNPRWASSLLAFLALACCAIPFTFYQFGAAIRKHSKYAYSE
ncbi:major facilitator superfamily transporter multidrug resistance [Grosmannia clavigera kw1407]|uniref:Major facilitator superfamily transporter multidrug resistance n=1 Tax=Grosmannia clavigera (strain kw1407 / UAMH 11150) TaxID=655863 RepID=F0XHY4_GROCL|nr:major facilitator superfamily transporter multidrug resistance [Grosmannia clavigera kw1407]EFX02659.1 major facilitator superfamily transporter multidrug resistance [Grosmannia clavigera kw1407]